MPSVFGLLTHAITDNCMNINLHSSEYNAGAHHDNAMSQVFIKLSLKERLQYQKLHNLLDYSVSWFM